MGTISSWKRRVKGVPVEDHVFNATAEGVARPTSADGTSRRRCIKSGADEILEQEADETEEDDEDILIFAAWTDRIHWAIGLSNLCGPTYAAQPRKERATLLD